MLVVPLYEESPHAEGLDILADGIKEIAAFSKIYARSFEGVTKESLADKPLKIVLKESQKYLSLGYDMAKQHMTLKQQGVDVEKLLPVP